jgi:hypothetical protein
VKVLGLLHLRLDAPLGPASGPTWCQLSEHLGYGLTDVALELSHVNQIEFVILKSL